MKKYLLVLALIAATAFIVGTSTAKAGGLTLEYIWEQLGFTQQHADQNTQEIAALKQQLSELRRDTEYHQYTGGWANQNLEFKQFYPFATMDNLLSMASEYYGRGDLAQAKTLTLIALSNLSLRRCIDSSAFVDKNLYLPKPLLDLVRTDLSNIYSFTEEGPFDWSLTIKFLPPTSQGCQR